MSLFLGAAAQPAEADASISAEIVNNGLLVKASYTTGCFPSWSHGPMISMLGTTQFGYSIEQDVNISSFYEKDLTFWVHTLHAGDCNWTQWFYNDASLTVHIKNETKVKIESPADGDIVSGFRQVTASYFFENAEGWFNYNKVYLLADKKIIKILNYPGGTGTVSVSFYAGNKDFINKDSIKLRAAACREGDIWGNCIWDEITVYTKNICEVDSVAVSGAVVPLKTPGNTKAEVKVSLKKPAPSAGCKVDLNVAPVLKSGGHDHNEMNDGRPKGVLSNASVSFSQGETGPKTVTYTSSEVGGTEEIVAKINSKEVGKAQVEVKVPGLERLSGGEFRLTGQTNAHSDNHYGTSNTVEKTNLIAEDFFNQFKATLGINDMCLKDGGAFDIYGHWLEDTTYPQCRQKGHGHCSHRKGTSVDIDRNALGPNGWIKVDRVRLEKICNNHGGSLVPEATIHCEITTK